MSKYASLFLIGSADYEQISSNLRLRKFGSWLAEEAWLREEQNKKRAQFTLKTIQLARKIAKAKGIEEEEAFNILQSDGPDRAAIFEEFSEETSKLMDLMPSGKDQFEELVTIFFRNRGQVLDGKKWIDTSDWENEDTGKLPKNLLEKVESFMKAEDSDGEEEEEADAPK